MTSRQAALEQRLAAGLSSGAHFAALGSGPSLPSMFQSPPAASSSSSSSSPFSPLQAASLHPHLQAKTTPRVTTPGVVPRRHFKSVSSSDQFHEAWVSNFVKEYRSSGQNRQNWNLGCAV